MNISRIQKFIKEVEQYTADLGIEYCYDKKYNFYWKINDDLIWVVLIDSVEDIDNKVVAEYPYNKKIFISNCITNSQEIWTTDDLRRLKEIKKELNDEVLFFKILSTYFYGNSIRSYLELIEQLAIKYKSINEPNTISHENDNIIIKSIIEEYFKQVFKKNRNYYISKDGTTSVLIMESKLYNNTSYNYWYTFHSYQKQELKKFKDGYLFFYFKDKKKGLIIPEKQIECYLDMLNKTVRGNSIGWHIHFQNKNESYFMRLPKKGLADISNQANMENEVIKLSSTFKVLKAKY